MKKFIALVLLALPATVGAQTIVDINTAAEKATNIGNLIIGLAISIAVLWIIVNVVRYLIATNDPEKRKEGGYGILYGVVGLFVILSIWGLVAILRNSFRTDNYVPGDLEEKTTLPQARTRGNAGGGTSTRYIDSTGPSGGASSGDLIPGVNTGF